MQSLTRLGASPWAALSLLFVVGGVGCEKKEPPPPPAAKCQTDKDCAQGFICTGDAEDLRCQKGERSAAEIAEAQKKVLAEKQAKAEAAKAVKPGEGRLYVRLCPGFTNTIESIATVVAVHQETQSRHILNLALEIPEGGWETEFAFPSLPLGTYDVSVTYGIQVKGRPDTHPLLCDEKVRKNCKEDGKVREIAVVLPEDEPEREKKEDGSFKRRPCDFSAE